MPQPTLNEIYAKVPAIACKGLCHESCGPLILPDVERNLIRDRHDIDIPDAWETLQRRGWDGACPALNAFGRCSVYDDRPLICRLWGVVESMPCTFGCVPDRVLEDHEGHALIRAAEAARC